MTRPASIRAAAPAALVLTGVLLLSACAGGSTTSSTSAGAPDSSATFRYANATDAGKNYDPVSSGNPFAPGFLLPVYDRLFDIDATGAVIPMLATSSEVSTDGLTVTLKLREHVTFHDGTPFDAAAVKANIERGKTNPKSSVKASLSSVASVAVVDPNTVTLTLTKPNGALDATLSDRAGMMVSPAAMSKPNLDLMPVGAGPYKVVADDPGVKVTYQKYDGYYAPNADAVKTIEMSILIDPEARLRGLETGQFDGAALNMNQLDAAKRTSILIAPAPEVSTATYIIYLNMARVPALADPKVRAAMALAIDRDGINKGVLNGACKPSAQIFPDSYWASSKNIPNTALDYDPQKAKAMLAEAGYPNGFEITLAAINAQQYSNVAEAVAAQLSAIGLKVNVQVTEPVQLLGNFIAQKTTDAYVSIWPGANDPSTTVGSLYLPTGLYNPGALDVPAITTAAAEGLNGKDRAARATSYQALAEATVAQHVHLPICSASLPNALTSKVTNLRETSATALDLRNVTMSK